MSVVELFALEAKYNSDKNEYKNELNTINHAPGKQPTQRAAQLNADLQTLLLQMSNLLAPTSKEQFQLLGASDLLQAEYQQLTDANVMATMYKSHYLGLTLGAALLFFLSMRALIKPE